MVSDKLEEDDEALEREILNKRTQSIIDEAQNILADLVRIKKMNIKPWRRGIVVTTSVSRPEDPGF
jgi:hypothetical protein